MLFYLHSNIDTELCSANYESGKRCGDGYSEGLIGYVKAICKNISSKINCESAIGQHLITNPECAKTYTDDNFRIIGQARSSFHLMFWNLFT